MFARLLTSCWCCRVDGILKLMMLKSVGGADDVEHVEELMVMKT
jgi:hypothetical protein